MRAARRDVDRFLRDGPGTEISALRERCARDFNWTAIARRYLGLYHRLAGLPETAP